MEPRHYNHLNKTKASPGPSKGGENGLRPRHGDACVVDISCESSCKAYLFSFCCKYNNLRASSLLPSPPPLEGSGEARKLRAISSARLWRRRLYTCTLSTSSSRTTLMRRSNLVAGFVLRCIQRLSDPDADTRRCPWRDNRQTGGLSNTVLSY